MAPNWRGDQLFPRQTAHLTNRFEGVSQRKKRLVQLRNRNSTGFAGRPQHGGVKVVGRAKLATSQAVVVREVRGPAPKHALQLDSFQCQGSGASSFPFDAQECGDRCSGWTVGRRA